MNSKIATSLLYLMILSLGIVCTKVKDPVSFWTNKVTVVTGSVSAPIAPTSAFIIGSSISCNVSSLIGKTRGICWGQTSNVSIANSFFAQGTGIGTYNLQMNNLLPGKTYYYRAYILLATPSSALYGEVKSFTTPATCPIVGAVSITSVNYTTASLSGDITSDGGASVSAKGFVYSATNSSPLVGNGTVVIGNPSTSAGPYTAVLNNLSPGTTYYVRGFATNSVGTCYSNSVVIVRTTPLSCPTVSSFSLSYANTTNTASAVANVSADGGSPVTAKGIVFSTTTTFPTVTNGTIVLGNPNSSTGSFTANLTNLAPRTTYYARAFATNSVSTCYSTNIITITTSDCPTVFTTSPSSVNSNAATMGGNVTADGGSPVTAKGVVYSTTTTSPTITNATAVLGAPSTSTGAFTANLTGLSSGTTYYARAYATNATGTCYGSLITFTTISCPTVLTTNVTSITINAATVSGNVTVDGGAPVTAKGVIYSTTNTAPTITNGTAILGSPSSMTGSFSANLTNLSSGTTYYVRAYATNAAGTCYGSVITFSTTACPTVFTNGLSSLTSNTATISGNVTADGGASVTAKGVVYSTTTTVPTISNGSAVLGSPSSSIGSYISNLSSLAPGTTYFARTYATNASCTNYGATISFTPSTAGCPTVTTSSFIRVNSNTATLGGSVTASGTSFVSGKGVLVSVSNSSPTLGAPGVSTVSMGTNLGGYSQSVCCFVSGTTYYIRAYATNGSCTNYGGVISFVW